MGPFLCWASGERKCAHYPCLGAQGQEEHTTLVGAAAIENGGAFTWPPMLEYTEPLSHIIHCSRLVRRGTGGREDEGQGSRRGHLAEEESPMKTKGALDPRRPAPFHSHPSSVDGGSALTTEEWLRYCGRQVVIPPYPVSLVNSVPALIDPFVCLFDALFIGRSRPPLAAEGRLAVTEHGRCRFRRRSLPAITLREYMLRICNYITFLEPITLITVIFYACTLDPLPQEAEKDTEAAKHSSRLCALVIDSHSIHRFIIVAICLASKAIGDHFYSNSFYAKVGGITTVELNTLELELACLLNWRLQCRSRDAQDSWRRLEAFVHTNAEDDLDK